MPCLGIARGVQRSRLTLQTFVHNSLNKQRGISCDAYQLHQLEDAGYSLEISHVQPDAGQRIRLTRFCLHRRHLPRIAARIVAGTVHRHHGLRHHVTPIRNTWVHHTRSRSRSRSRLVVLLLTRTRSERRRGINTEGTRWRTGPVPQESRSRDTCCTLTTVRCALPINSEARSYYSFTTIAATTTIAQRRINQTST